MSVISWVYLFLHFLFCVFSFSICLPSLGDTIYIDGGALLSNTETDYELTKLNQKNGNLTQFKDYHGIYAAVRDQFFLGERGVAQRSQ